MAEPIGLVLGLVGLIGTFQSCISLFSLFLSSRALGRAYHILDTKLHVQKALLLQWATRVRLVHDDYDKRLDDPILQSTISRILAGIKLLLSESTLLEQRYGLRTDDTSVTSRRPEIESRASSITTSRMQQFNIDFDKLKINIKKTGESISRPTRMRWVVADKEKFEKLVQELSEFVSGLHQLVPETDHAAEGSMGKLMAEEDMSHLRDTKLLQLIYDATYQDQELIAEAAIERIKDLRAQRILDVVWFRSLDDRRDAVTAPHPETFHWALRSSYELLGGDERALWDDLPSWLATGDKVYWLSGKAGSGKSTLMKYLYTHSATQKLLSDWATSHPLSVGSFFFSNLGTSEQRSLNGLSRAILHQILTVQHELVPEILPKMWRDAQQGDRTDLLPPTDVDLNAAIDRLSTQKAVNRLFCFFIDGLDEFHGDQNEGIALVMKLACNPKIKIVVSSRPDPSCALAFSDFPSMRLQDLTRDDIASYVRSTVGAHPYMQDLTVSDPVNTASITEELVDKASGVFLWVVLACRSVIDGFAACDNLRELKQRVNELPPKLEDLFKHMLDRVEPRYHQQMAKMLKICHQRQIIPAVGEAKLIYTLAWALMDSCDFHIEHNDTLHVLSRPQRSSLCAPIEGRLRSRCGGLLEIKRRPQNCQCGSRNSEHDTVVDSTIEFMHRTMFEFLDNPKTWEHTSLDFDDSGFDANEVLAVMSLQMARIQLQKGSTSSHHAFIEDAIMCATCSGDLIGDRSFIVLSKLEKIAQVILQSTQSGSQPRISPLVLAVESGIVSCAKHLLRPSLDAHSQFPLLYHAIRRPLFWREVRLPQNHGMIRFLLAEGCQPNEQFRNAERLSTTPWRDWLREMHRMERGDIFRTLEITEAFIKAGADLKPLGLERPDQIVRRHMGYIQLFKSEGRDQLVRAERFLDLCHDMELRLGDGDALISMSKHDTMGKRKFVASEESDEADFIEKKVARKI
ncbi:prion-inhibition and propagation-domain-containing protein [Astrocystis sublimbata]|nr:prion-inhibition and propagation-domain-containing protein [Astrocystis sublimbata]